MVCTNAILRQGMLQRILLGMYLSAGGRLELRHVLPFTKDTKTELNNLEALFGVLPFCIAPGCAIIRGFIIAPRRSMRMRLLHSPSIFIPIKGCCGSLIIWKRRPYQQ